MSILDKYNKKPLFMYDSEKEREYKNLEDLIKQHGEEKQYQLQALFINKKSRYGDAPILVTERYMINAPHHLVDTVKEMMIDTELINLVNDRKVGFTIYGYNGKNGLGYSVQWIEFK